MRSQQDFKHYMNSWNEKWQIVKDLMCSKDHYNCDLLEEMDVTE